MEDNFITLQVFIVLYVQQTEGGDVDFVIKI